MSSACPNSPSPQGPTSQPPMNQGGFGGGYGPVGGMSFLGNKPDSFNYASTSYDHFNGDGSTTTFTLSRSVTANADVFVTVANVPQDPGVAYYVQNLNQLVFTGAPVSGSQNIQVTYRQYVQSGIAPGANTVTQQAIAANTIQAYHLTNSLLVPVINTFTGDGSTVNFTLPANSTTASTIVSVNGIIQIPGTAYGVTGSTVTFTEAPLSSDRIDFRIITTTKTVTSIADAAGTTMVYMDKVANDHAVSFKNNGVDTVSFDAGGNIVLQNNQAITADGSSTTVGTSATTVDSFATGSARAAKYVFVARNSGSTQWTTVEALVVHDGTTASISAYNVVNTGATTQITLSATISGGLVLVQATGAAAGTVVNKQKIYVVGS